MSDHCVKCSYLDGRVYKHCYECRMAIIEQMTPTELPTHDNTGDGIPYSSRKGGTRR